MAEINWAAPALDDLNAIAEYIALDKLGAASDLVRRVVAHVEMLEMHPKMGPCIPELRPSGRYRQLVEPPRRVFYRYDRSADVCHILHVMRGQQLFQKHLLFLRDAP